MRKKIIIGNWKMNMTTSEAINFISSFDSLIKNNDFNGDFGFAIPAIFLSDVIKENDYKNLIIAAQNVNENKSGAFTGEISISMLKEIGVSAVVVGHSERRQYYNETDNAINHKMKLILENNMTPILCVGETLEEFEANQTKSILEKQLKICLNGINDFKNIVIAYEPIWAIGTGKTATAQQAQDMCSYIRSITSNDVRIQYGGSVKSSNIQELMAQPDIDGALVGGASLDYKEFYEILKRGL